MGIAYPSMPAKPHGPYKFSGERLCELRKNAGLSRMGLCKLMDMIVGPEAIASYEYGKYKPGIEVGMELARALGVKVKDLFE